MISLVNMNFLVEAIEKAIEKFRQGIKKKN